MSTIARVTMRWVAAGSLLWGGGAAAADQGFYAGVGGGVGRLEADYDHYEDSVVSKIFAGYNLGRHIGVELAYTDLGKFELPTTSYALPMLSVSGVQLAAIGQWPVGDRFSVFGKLGGYSWSYKSLPCWYGCSDSGISFYAALGAQYMFTANLGMRAEFEGYADISGDVFTTTASVVAKF